MPHARIITADCLVALPTFSASTFDLVLSDLPYGKTQNAWDTPLAFAPMWAELLRVTKPNAAIVLMAAQPFAAQLICSNLEHFRYDLIWRKNKPTGFLNAKRQPLRTHEHILVFYRSPPIYNPQKTRDHEPGHYAKRAKKSENYGAYESTEYGGSTERYPTSVLDVPIINNDDPDKQHPTQKPVALMEWLILTYTNPQAIVLDITAGAGSTGVACQKHDRHFLGIEMHAPYADLARQRLEEK